MNLQRTFFYNEQTGIWHFWEGDACGEGSTATEAESALIAVLNRMERDDIAEGDRSRAALIG